MKLWHRLRLRIYDWIDERGRVPRWAGWIWRDAHWCSEMDYLLILWNTWDCCCEGRP